MKTGKFFTAADPGNARTIKGRSAGGGGQQGVKRKKGRKYAGNLVMRKKVSISWIAWLINPMNRSETINHAETLRVFQLPAGMLISSLSWKGEWDGARFVTPGNLRNFRIYETIDRGECMDIRVPLEISLCDKFWLRLKFLCTVPCRFSSGK